MMTSTDAPTDTHAPDAPLATRTLASPIGDLRLYAAPAGLRAILFPENRHLPRLEAGAPPSGARTSSSDSRTPTSGGRTPSSATRTAAAHLDAAARQLDDYFAGRRRSFDLALDGLGTPFQRIVWAALLRIPFAATWSYGQLAAAIGKPSASRAVGAANGRNPLPIVVPCHRVIGGDGALTGFGGGLPTKRWLLAHEAAQLAPPLPL